MWVNLDVLSGRHLSIPGLLTTAFNSDSSSFIPPNNTNSTGGRMGVFINREQGFSKKVLSLSADFTPCRHLRPSSGRVHTLI